MKEDTYVQCPYYRKDGPQAVHCEGVADGVGLRLGFAGKTVMEDYKDTFCRGKWTGCMIAKMLNLKYDYAP